MEDGAHVDAPAETGLRQRRLEQVAPHRVVHAHVVDAVPDDHGEGDPENQQASFNPRHGESLRCQAAPG